MQTHDRPTMLFRIEPAKNMKRFYSISVQPNLFGGVSVIRNWGRIGSSGQIQIHLLETKAQAISMRDRILKTKERRGYRLSRQEFSVN